MADLLEDVDLLEDLTSRELIFHVWFLDRFNRYFLASKFVDPECDFSKGSFADEFKKSVIV